MATLIDRYSKKKRREVMKAIKRILVCVLSVAIVGSLVGCTSEGIYMNSATDRTKEEGVIEEMIDDAVEGVEDATDDAMDGIDDLVEDGTDGADDLAEDAMDGVDDLAEDTMDGVDDLADDAENTISDAETEIDGGLTQ